MKILLITNIPASYRVDLFNSLADHYGDNIYFCFVPDSSSSHKQMLRVEHSETDSFLKRTKFFYDDSPTRALLDLFKYIYEVKPDLIVEDGFPARILLEAIYARFTGTAFYTWLAETPFSATSRGAKRKVFRKVVSGFLDGAVLYSEHVRPYLSQLNSRINQVLILGNNTRDASKYAGNVDKFAQSKSQCGKLSFVTVGFQTPRKNTKTILAAYQIVKEAFQDIELIIVGDGSELSALKQMCQESNIQDVEFLGAVKPQDMPEVYARADVLLHSAWLDQWPQTFNEAAAAGLAILISSTSGVWNRYIEDHYREAVFQPDQVSELARLMTNLVMHPDQLQNLKSDARDYAMNHDCQFAFDNWVEFFDKYDANRG